MSAADEYDVVILGSGAPGKLLAWTLASQGKRTGGHRAAVCRRVVPQHRLPPEQERDPRRQGRRAISAGAPSSGSPPATGRSTWPPSATASGRWWTGWSRSISRSTGRAARSSSWATGASSRRRPIEVALNAGGTRTLRGQTVVINTGSRARIDDTPGLAESRPLTHVEALDLDHLPEHLIVLGGGYVGLELAQAFRRFGSRVTVVERNGSLIHREDPDVTEAIERLFRDEGIEVLTGTAVAARRGEIRTSPSACTRRAARSRGRTSSSPGGARRTPTASAWRRPGSRRTSGGTSRSTSGSRRRPRTSGRRATAPAARTSRTSARTTSAWCWPTSPAGIA